MNLRRDRLRVDRITRWCKVSKSIGMVLFGILVAGCNWCWWFVCSRVDAGGYGCDEKCWASGILHPGKSNIKQQLLWENWPWYIHDDEVSSVLVCGFIMVPVKGFLWLWCSGSLVSGSYPLVTTEQCYCLWFMGFLLQVNVLRFLWVIVRGYILPFSLEFKCDWYLCP